MPLDQLQAMHECRAQKRRMGVTVTGLGGIFMSSTITEFGSDEEQQPSRSTPLFGHRPSDMGAIVPVLQYHQDSLRMSPGHFLPHLTLRKIWSYAPLL